MLFILRSPTENGRLILVIVAVWLCQIGCAGLHPSESYGEWTPWRVQTRPNLRRLPVEEYIDKMKGGWVGQMAGVGWGGPTEFHAQGRILPENEVPQWKPEMINQFGQDDIYVEMTFLHTLEQYGFDCSIRQAGIDFANSSYELWHANKEGRNNLRKGIAPPDSGHPEFNKHSDDIDYQIESDFSGLIAPGLPNIAVELGEKFGRLMNYGDGLYGGQFVGGMYAEAFFETDMEKIVNAGLKCIPAKSQYAECIRDVLAWYKKNPLQNWQKTWQLINEKYHLDPAYRRFSCSGPKGQFNIDAKINGAYIVMGLLYGKGDPDKTIIISTRCGQDSDCNPSSAAGVLFTTIGFAKLPDKFKSALNPEGKFSHTPYNFPTLVEVCRKLAHQAVVRSGGRVEKSAEGREIFVVPQISPKRSSLEQCWQSGPIPPNVFVGGQHFTQDEMALITAKDSSQFRHGLTQINTVTKEKQDEKANAALQKVAGKNISAVRRPVDRAVTVSHTDGKWIIAGKKNKVILNESDLAMKVEAGSVNWTMAPSLKDDMLAKSKGEEFYLRLADAGKIDITPYDTGYKTGVKIRLEQFRPRRLASQNEAAGELDLALCLTVCLEGRDEELVCEAVAIEREALVRQLDWPKEFDANDVDYTVLNHVRGNLLPRNWPSEYHPYRNVPRGQESLIAADKSIIQSNLIECWSMSWWGFQKGESAMILIVETSDDAAYKFHHPAGGPTVIGPRWLACLGKLDYPRSVRMCFFQKGNYVDLCKRYRRYVMDTGQFVSLKEKIAQEPLVAKLIGTPHLRQHIMRNYKPGSHRYDTKNPERNYNVTSFDERAKQLRELKARGIDRLYVTLAGWPYMGYDRQHPDVLPPAPAAGGWEGMKRWADTCRELGYIYNLHDQYRDYYIDAPSYDPQFAVHEEDTIGPPKAFPGTRFGSWKEGHIPFMDYWDGGKMAYLNKRFALGHLVKNYRLMFDHGIKMQGSYLDVFGYVPPTEDFNPEHPTTRADAMKYRALCFKWARNNLGIVGTEAGADWVVPYVDYSSGANAGRCISVPLYNLVYHDAIMTPEGGVEDHLRCLLNGGYPTLPRDIENKKNMELMRRICALHERVALLEMTNHEFLDNNYRRERTTFADGTTVTIDRDSGTFEIRPELKLQK